MAENEEIAEIRREGLVMMNTDMLQIYISGNHYDCTLVVRDEGKRTKAFKCHRLILASASPVFECLLFGKFEEACKSKDEIIAIDDVSENNLDAVIRFIYGKQIIFPSFEVSAKIYQFSSKWQIKMLDKLAAAYCMTFEMKPDELLALYKLFKQHREPRAETLLQMIGERCCEVLGCAAWSTISRDVVTDILKSDKLNIRSEKQLFDALVYWGKCELGKKQCSNEEIRAKVDDLINLVRFDTMSLEEFSQLCDQSNVLTDAEKLDVFTCKFRGCCEGSQYRVKMCHQEISYKFPLVELNALNSSNPLAFQFSVSRDFYLLGVGVYSLSYLNRSNTTGFDIHVEVLEQGGKSVSSGWYKFDYPPYSSKMIFDLKNPCLLEEDTDYSLIVSYPKNTLIERANLQLDAEDEVLDVGDDLEITIFNRNLGDVFAINYSELL